MQRTHNPFQPQRRLEDFEIRRASRRLSCWRMRRVVSEQGYVACRSNSECSLSDQTQDESGDLFAFLALSDSCASNDYRFRA